MTIYLYITITLLTYPVLTYFLVRQTMRSEKIQKRISLVLLTILLLTVIGILTQTITIFANLNYFLATFIYFIVSYFLWLTFIHTDKIAKLLIKISMFSIFSLGGILATLGFFFLLILSTELTPIQDIWVADNLIYKERNIGSGPDPSVRLKRIEVYKTYDWCPIIAQRIQNKEYDDWEGNLGTLLETKYNVETKKLYLTNSMLNLSDKYKRWTDSLKIE